jgi:hypothetical protein
VTGTGEIRSSSGEKFEPRKNELGLTATGDKSEGFDAAGGDKLSGIGPIVSPRFLVSTACFCLLHSDTTSLGFDRSCHFFVDQSAKSDDGSSSMS